MSAKFDGNAVVIATTLWLASVTSFLEVGGNCVHGENIISGIAQDRVDRVGRYFGVGWGDGYQACGGSGCRPGADLPPVGSRTLNRRADAINKIDTFYDRFDARQSTCGDTIHPKHYRVNRPLACPDSYDHGEAIDPMAWEPFAFPTLSKPTAPAERRHKNRTIDSPAKPPEQVIESPSDAQAAASPHQTAQTPRRLVTVRSPTRLPLVASKKPKRIAPLSPSSPSSSDRQPARPRRLPAPHTQGRVAQNAGWETASETAQPNRFIR